MTPVCLSHKEIKNGMLDQSKYAVFCVNADYLEMVVYMSCFLTQDTFALRPEMYIEGNVLLSSFTFVRNLVFVGSTFSIPKAAVCTCEHLCQTSHVFMDFSVISMLH